MATPYFIADSANVTILRSLASSAFGSYSLNLPEGIDLEDVHDFDAPGNELGFVAGVSSGKRVGGLARRFVRADVSVTAADSSDPDVIPESNVDQTLRDVSDRVSGDFFLESDVSKAGLGPWVPFVDFQVGDMARVEIWGQVVILPVTRIEPVISDHDVVDWTVHVGGQLVSDEEARQAENQALHRAVVQDRRELAGIEAVAKSAKSTAETAQGTAETADGKADTITVDLTGDMSTTIPDAVVKRSGTLGVIQSGVDRAQTDQLVLHGNQLKWIQWTRYQEFFVEDPVDNEFFYAARGGDPANRIDFVKRGTWAGQMIVQHRNHAGQVQWAKVDIPSGAYDHQFHQGFDSSVSALHNAVISITPYWGNAPREYVLRGRDTGRGFHYSDAYVNPREGNPISWDELDEIAFNVPVIADQRIYIAVSEGIISQRGSGSVIEAGERVTPHEDSANRLVTFTEVLPEVDWGGEAPLTGVENFDLAARLLSYNTHTTLKRWVAPNWPAPRTVTFTYVVRMRTTQALATYESSVWINGTREHWSRVTNDLFPKTTYRIERTRENVQPGELFEFAMFSGSGDVDDRYVSGGSVRIEWS